MIDWLVHVLDKFLASKFGLFLALVCPLAVLPFPAAVKQIENLISSNWIQLWALFVLAIMAKNGHKKHDELNDKVDFLHYKMNQVHEHLGVQDVNK